MINEQQTRGTNKINYRDKTPWEILVDMLFGDFDSSGFDKTELLKICTDCLDVANCPYTFMSIAEYFVDLSEFSLARNTYRKAEELLDGTGDYIYLAQSIIDNLDLSWGMKILNRAIKMNEHKPDLWDYTLIANTFADNIGDYKKATAYYKMAEEYAILPRHYEFIAEGVIENLRDMTWYAELIEKARHSAELMLKN